MTVKKKLLLNTMVSLVNQLLTIVCGFILPRFFLLYYGSKVNGLISSITQFLGFITLAELGVGAVVQSALYKPLAENNNEEISKIIKSSERFFKKIAIILLIYSGILIIVYPTIINNNFSYFYTASLIFAISISSFVQYFFSISYRLLLNADQLAFIQVGVQTISLVLNTIMCIILMKLGMEVQLVKLATSIIFLIQPIYITYYVKKHYHLDRNIEYEDEPVKQKWNGMAQHVAAVVLNNTDTIVLTLFSTLENVSIYAVYFLVVNGVKSLFLSLTNGFQSLMGELWAKQRIDKLKVLFSWVEWSMHTLSIIVFGCTASLILPFVSVYTKGIQDANYLVPEFAVLITIAFAGPCIRLPYYLMILAAGHYKQTQANHIWAAVINIIISVAFVKKFGLIGVAIGTICAMFYQTFWMAYYNSKQLIKWPIKFFLKQMLTDCLTGVMAYTVCKLFSMKCNNYLEWIVLAVKTFAVWIIVVFVINMICYREKMINILKIVKSKMARKMK